MHDKGLDTCMLGNKIGYQVSHSHKGHRNEGLHTHIHWNDSPVQGCHYTSKFHVEKLGKSRFWSEEICHTSVLSLVLAYVSHTRRKSSQKTLKRTLTHTSPNQGNLIKMNHSPIHLYPHLSQYRDNVQSFVCSNGYHYAVLFIGFILYQLFFLEYNPI